MTWCGPLDLVAHWATAARHALAVVSITPTPAPMIWVDVSQQPGITALVRLSLQTTTWEASGRWQALLTADVQLAETFLSLEVTRPMVYSLVVHFHLVRHRTLLASLAHGGAFHLALVPSGQVIPFVPVSTLCSRQVILQHDVRKIPCKSASRRAPAPGEKAGRVLRFLAVPWSPCPVLLREKTGSGSTRSSEAP